MKLKTKHLMLALLMACGIADASAQQLAFPGAQGWGRFATGGRTGKVYHVTNLNDSGTGSLRDAVSQPNRIVVFDVAGVINISSRIVFSKNLYVAGQTAPGEGITVYGNGVSFSGADNIIVRHMRFRMGTGGDSGKDCAGIANGKNMIFDHCSFAWGRDETFSISWDSKGSMPTDITISNSIVGQGLLTHSAGGLMQSDNITLYRNFYCDNSTRNNKIKGINQYVNNIVYNWKNGCYIMGGGSEGESFCNIESNLFINGPAKGGDAFSGGNANFHFYGDDNWQDSNIDGVFSPSLVTKYSASDRQTEPYDYPELDKWPGNELVDKLLPIVGASLPYRDYTDCYMIDEVMSYGKQGALISTEKSLAYGAPNTWNVWKGETRVDTDGDGMPDAWEKANGTNPNADDAMTIADNGYANIENYINSITAADRDYFLRAPLCFEEQKVTTTTVVVTWKDYTDNEDGFIIEMEKGGAYVEVARVPAGTTTYTFTNLEPATLYNVRMRAYAGTENYSEYLAGCTITTRPLEEGVVDIDSYQPDLTWTDGATTWDLSALSWNGNTAVFDDSKSVLFAPTTDATVDLTTIVLPSTVVVNSDANVTMTGKGGIGGVTSVNKGGEGTLVLGTTNSYTGATVLHEGVIEFNSLKNGGEPSALGSSMGFAQNWVFDGGTYKYTGATTSTDRGGKLMRETALNISESASVVTMNGVFEGTGNLVIDGVGQLKVGTTKFFGYTGATILAGGMLNLGTTEATKNGIGSSSKLVFAGGHLKTAGETEGYETYSFPIEVRENTVSQFTPNRNCSINSKITGKGTLQINIPYLREYWCGSSLSEFEGRLIANGTSSEKEGSLMLFNKGFTGIPNLVIELKGNARVGHWDTHATMAIGGLSGSSATYLSGSSKNTANFNCTWNIGGANTNETFHGKINNWAVAGSKYSGTVNINKVGTGEWRLTGTNDYKGKTQVLGGTLIVNGTNNGTGEVSVANNAVLKGKGTVAGKVTVKSGGTVCAGDTTVITSILKLNGGLTLSEGSVAQLPIAMASTTAKSNRIKVTGAFAIDNATLVIDMSDITGAIPAGTKFKLFDISNATVSGSGFTTIEPAVPSAEQTWDVSALLTEGIITVLGGDSIPEGGDEPGGGDNDNPGGGTDDEPVGEIKTALLTWGNMTAGSYDGVNENNMLTGVEGDDAEGFKMVVTGNLVKNYSKADKITVEYKDQQLSRTTIKCSNGAENSVFLPENAKATKITLWSYTNYEKEEEPRTCYWANVAGVDYTAETTTVLNGTKDTSNPNCVSFDLDKVADVVTFRNTGEQQCVIVSLEYYISEGGSGIENVVGDTTPVSVMYYTLAGERVQTPAHGIYIMRATTASGKVITRKVIL